ncbi:MAG: hypothetical protein CM1200mP14_28250 [Gammaproteobacteria bacterium]|nr:MAG: hypothetical protein CM1200mP14_28250 [Gammaproteobacteria bacterium]
MKIPSEDGKFEGPFERYYENGQLFEKGTTERVNGMVLTRDIGITVN